MIGDSVWDARAASRSGMRMIGLLAGGFGRDELVAAGAERVYVDVLELSANLDQALSAHPAVVSV
jgi:phosphoglycolate phosphatase-like HAD superfamily hydrolase